jgi:putative transposase
MPRRLVQFTTNEFYHVYNRGVDKQIVFQDQRDFQRAIDLIDYYRYDHPPVKYSVLVQLPQVERRHLLQKLGEDGNVLVDIVAFCFMPNHYHLLLCQRRDRGVTRFAGIWQDSLVRYINTRHDRVGPLFQGSFRAVHVIGDAQLLHLSRYIHLNPYASSVVKHPSSLKRYPWSSLPTYLSGGASFCHTDPVMDQFASRDVYHNFVFDRADYQRSLKEVRHLLLEK